MLMYMAHILQLRMENETECPFLVFELSVKIETLQHLSTVNQILVEVPQPCQYFYHLCISLVLSTHSQIDGPGYAQPELNKTLD